MRQMDRLTDIPRNAADDLFVAFIACGWEMFFGEEDAEQVAYRLSVRDPDLAWKLSGQLMRGEDMSPDVLQFVRSAGEPK